MRPHGAGDSSTAMRRVMRRAHDGFGIRSAVDMGHHVASAPSPTDTKLAAKIVRGGVKLANKHGVKLRQSFERTVPKLLAAQRGRRTKGGAAAARKAARRLKTIAGQVVRQLDAGLPAETKDRRWLSGKTTE